MSIAYKYKRHWDERKTITTIEELKSVSNKENRYDFFELNHIVENNLGFNTRGCGEGLANLGLVDNSHEYYDYWHYQLDAVFRRDVRNESANFNG